MERAAQRQLAELFHRLHDGPAVLVVGSAWDAGSAVVFERAGFTAIATSSAGVAFSLGYPDGERIPRAALLAAVAQVVRAVRIPVSADIETGHGRTPAEVSDTCRRVLDSGAIGVNLEDTSGDAAQPLVEPALQAEKLRAVRAMADAYGVPLVINARTDGYMLGLGDAAARFTDAVQRLNLYRAAGADCLFAPGLIDRDVIARLAKAVHGPLNILATAGAPSVAELAALGVRRLSQGSGPARAALATTRRIALELAQHGTYGAYTADTIDYAQANQMFEPAG
jgi:2-methylisocitrate lyase-like PEP mutase family enzyme